MGGLINWTTGSFCESCRVAYRTIAGASSDLMTGEQSIPASVVLCYRALNEREGLALGLHSGWSRATMANGENSVPPPWAL